MRRPVTGFGLLLACVVTLAGPALAADAVVSATPERIAVVTVVEGAGDVQKP